MTRWVGLLLIGCCTAERVEDERHAVDVLAFDRSKVRLIADRMQLPDIPAKLDIDRDPFLGPSGHFTYADRSSLRWDRELMRADIRVRLWLHGEMKRDASLMELAEKLRADPQIRNSVYLVSSELPIDHTKLDALRVGPSLAGRALGDAVDDLLGGTPDAVGGVNLGANEELMAAIRIR